MDQAPGSMQDVAGALRAQEGQGGLRDEQRPEHVGVELRARLGLGDLLDHPELAVAGVVDDDVERAEVVVCLPHGGEDGVPVVDVELERQYLVAELLHQVVEALRVAGRGRHVAQTGRANRDSGPVVVPGFPSVVSSRLAQQRGRGA